MSCDASIGLLSSVGLMFAFLMTVYYYDRNQEGNHWDWDKGWQENKPLADTNLHMLKHGLLSDITLVAGVNGTMIRAHKFMLASRSPVFCAMFTGIFGRFFYTSSLAIPDIEPDILSLLIKYMYTEKCDITTAKVTPLMYAAEKYNVTGLVRICNDVLQKHPQFDRTWH